MKRDGYQSPPAFVSTSHTMLSSAWRFSTSTTFIARSTIEDIARQVRADYERWSKLVDKANIRIN